MPYDLISNQGIFPLLFLYRLKPKNEVEKMNIAIVCSENMFPRLVGPIQKLEGIEIAGPLKSPEEVFQYINERPDGLIIDHSLSFWEEVKSFPTNTLVYYDSKSYAVQVLAWIESLKVTLPKEKKPKEAIPPTIQESSTSETGVLVLSKITEMVEAVKKINGVHVLNVLDSFEDFKVAIQVHSPQVVLLDEFVFPEADQDDRRLQVIFRMMDILQLKAIKLSLLLYKREDKAFYTRLIERGMFNFISKNKLNVQDIEQLLKADCTFKDVEAYYEKSVDEQSNLYPKEEVHQQEPTPPFPYEEKKIEPMPIEHVEPLESAVPPFEEKVSINPKEQTEPIVVPKLESAKNVERAGYQSLYAQLKSQAKEEGNEPSTSKQNPFRGSVKFQGKGEPKQETKSSMIQEGLGLANESLSLPAVRPETITVYSGKGGVGVDAITLNLAGLFSKIGIQTSVIDFGFPYGHMSSYLEVAPSPFAQDIVQGSSFYFSEVDLLRLTVEHQNIRYYLPPNIWPEGFRYAENVIDKIIRNMQRLATITLCNVNNAHNIQEQMMAFSLSTKVFWIMDLNKATVFHTKRQLVQLKEHGFVDFGKIHFILNRVAGRDLDIGLIEEALGSKTLAILPEDREVAAAMNKGIILTQTNKATPFVKELERFIAPIVGSASGGKLTRFFSRR
jgi:MinD-like ATPase involved in chromosome partitioning or flagellar assembly